MTRSQVGGVDFVWEICLPRTFPCQKHGTYVWKFHHTLPQDLSEDDVAGFEIVETTSNLNGYNLCKENLIEIAYCVIW